MRFLFPFFIFLFCLFLSFVVSAPSSPSSSSSSSSSLSSLDDFSLENWQGSLGSIINSQTILDITLPGTHDTLTYNLSLYISDGAWDNHDSLSVFLHDLFQIVGKWPVVDDLSSWIRTQAQTQTLSIIDQLNSGIRFIDFRNMYTSIKLVDYDWYGLHFLQTEVAAMIFLKDIKQWLLDHPQEWLVIWISKHGGEKAVGQEQYPNVSATIKQDYWVSIEELFGDLLIDNHKYPINTTPISQYLSLGQRLLIIASDYKEFTLSSPYAIDSALHLDNILPGLGDNLTINIPQLITDLKQNYPSIINNNKQNNTFTLMSLAGDTHSAQGMDSYLLKFFPLTPSLDEKNCAKSFDIPGMTEYCPLRLIDCVSLSNYYNQLILESALNDLSLQLPNAIYIDGVIDNGLIHIGVGDNDTRGYSYVDTLLLINVQKACADSSIIKNNNNNNNNIKKNQEDCESAINLLLNRRSSHPLQLWNDSNGRQIGWPINITAVETK